MFKHYKTEQHKLNNM